MSRALRRRTLEDKDIKPKKKESRYVGDEKKEKRDERKDDEDSRKHKKEEKLQI